MDEGLFADLAFHHVGFSVGDIEKAIAFYGEVFGLNLEFRKYIAPIDTHLAFLRRGDFRFEIFQKAGSRPVPDHRRAPNADLAEQGTKHPCFSVGDCQHALELLAARPDVEIVGIVRRPGDPMVHEADPRLSPGDARPPAAAFFFRDPCDLIVEIVAKGSFPQ
jgi:catechol 2,3-dioxygenase-like lactoylglutathione lyase family enzyme